jgi:hypothetical protein
MNKLRFAAGMSVLFCALCAIATSASAAEFITKNKCAAGNLGCFAAIKSTATQKFAFETEEKIPFKISCTEMTIKEGFYPVAQEKIKEVQLSGPQKLAGAEIGKEQEEKANMAMIKPLYSGCLYEEKLGKSATFNLDYKPMPTENKTCVWAFNANGEFSMMPNACELLITVPIALPNCQIRLKAAENVKLKEVAYKVNGGNVVFELFLKKLRGEQNGECEAGMKSKFEGSYTGKFEVEKTEFK